MVKEFSLSKCIKDCKLVALPKKTGVAFICIDSKGRSFILFYSVQNLSEQAVNAYDNLPIVGFQSDLSKTNAVYLLHTDGKISVRVYRSFSHDYVSKMDQFKFGNQPTLCPSVSVSFGGKKFFCIADCEKIHKYSYSVNSDQSLCILSDFVEYYNAPIQYLALISFGVTTSKLEIDSTFLWSGHHNGLITIWKFKVCLFCGVVFFPFIYFFVLQRNPINEMANFVEISVYAEIDRSTSPHKKEIIFICQANDQVYSVSRDGIVACWGFTAENCVPKLNRNFDFRKSVPRK